MRKKLVYLFPLLISACSSADQEKNSSQSLTIPVVTDTEKTGTQISTDTAVIKNNIPVEAEEKENKEEQKATYEIFKNENGSFGYDIFVNGKKYVHQNIIPGTSGNNGFSSEADAKQTAALVCRKIDNNIMPPSVSQTELDSLGVRKK